MFSFHSYHHRFTVWWNPKFFKVNLWTLSEPLATSHFPACIPPGCASKRQILSSFQHVQKSPSIAEQQWCFSTAYMRISSFLFPKGNHSACRNLLSLPRSTSGCWRENITHSVHLRCCSPTYLCNESLLLTNTVGTLRGVSAKIPTKNLDKCFQFQNFVLH